MRNFKKVIALVLAVALMMSTFTVAFAAEDTTASKLVTLGLLSDASASSLSAGLTREIGLTMILKDLGYTQADADKAAKAPFTDTKGWVTAWANLAYEKGISKGTTATTFGGSAKLTGDVFLTFALRGLGVTVPATKDAAALAITAGLLPAGSTVPATFTKGDAVVVMFNSLSVVVDAAKKTTLLDKLIAAKVVTEANAVAVGLKAANLQISSITAPNARQVVIAFNKDVNADTITTDNVKVYIGSNAGVTTWAKAVDGKTVTLGLTAAVGQDTDVKVVIKNVEAKSVATDKIAAEVTTTVRMKDVTAPMILSAVATTSKSYVITTSEPLDISSLGYQVISNITIDGVKLVGALALDYAANTVTVTLGSKLAVGDHPIVIDGYKDIVGFAAAKFTGTLSVVADTATPVITSVETVSKDSIKLNFNEPISAIGTITVDTFAITSATASADNKTWTIVLGVGHPLGLASLIKSTVSYIGTTDMEGNTITTDAKTFDFVAADDLVAPTAVVTFDPTTNKVKVVFSELVSAAGTVTVKDKDGATTATGTPTQDLAADSTGKTYMLATGVTAAATYTVELKDSKDASVRTNAITTTKTTLTSIDITAPTVIAVVSKTSYAAGPPVVNGQATVFFSEAMDVASISNLANYLVDLTGGGTTVSLSTISGAAAVAAADAKSVVLTIPGSTYDPDTTTISVLAVKDAAGTYDVADFNVATVVDSAAGALSVSAADATATNKIKVTFGNPMATIDPSEFLVKTVAGVVTLVGVSYELDAAGLVATITLNGNLTTDAEAVNGDTLALVQVAGVNTKDIYGTAAVKANTAVVDKIRPTVSDIAADATSGIDISFSEPVGGAAMTEALLVSDLIIKDADGVVINPTGNIAYSLAGVSKLVTNAAGFDKIVVTGLTAGKTYTVEVVARNVKDLTAFATKNIITAKAATSVTAK